MNRILLLALFCLTITSAQKGNKKLWWNDTKANLLKSNNFLDHVGKDKIVIVQFIAQFSRECQALLPEWDKLALMYQGDNPKRLDVTVALIDGWTFNSISQSYGVTAFPSIIIFRKGDAQTQTVYKGEKKAEKMSEWIEQFANGLIPPDAAPTGNPEASTDANPNNQAPPAADNNAQPTNPPPTPPPAQDQQQQQQPPQDQQQQQQQQQPPTPPPQEPQAAQPVADNAQAAPQEPPAQPAQTQQPVAQQAPPQPVEPREVNVVLNTSLLQVQFEELQRHTTALTESLQKSINDNFQRFESLKGVVETHKEDLTRVGNNVLSHIQKFDEVKQSLQNQKNDIHKSVTDHTKQQIDELKSTIQQIKTKVFEHRAEEPREAGSAFGSTTVMFVVGGLVGAAVTFVIVSAQGGKNKRKLLID